MSSTPLGLLSEIQATAHQYTLHGHGDAISDFDTSAGLTLLSQPLLSQSLLSQSKASKPDSYSQSALWNETGRQVRPHAEKIRILCIETANRADELGRTLGLDKRFARHIEALDWHALTIKELALELDELLKSKQGQLLSSLEAVEQHLLTEASDSSEAFRESLKSTWTEFQRLMGGNTQENLNLFKQMLNDTLSQYPEPFPASEDVSGTKTPNGKTSQLRNQFNNFCYDEDCYDEDCYDEDEDEDEEDEEEEEEEEEENRVNHQTANSSPMINVQNEPTLPASASKASETIEFKHTPYINKDQPDASTPENKHDVDFSEYSPIMSDAVNKEALKEKKLIRSSREYQLLCDNLGQNYMEWPGVVPRLQAFKNLQKINPSLNANDFVILMRALPASEQEDWCQRINAIPETAASNKLIPHCRDALYLLASHSHVDPQILAIIRSLELNALSTSDILHQLQALSTLFQGLEGVNLEHQVMVFLVNEHLISENTMESIQEAWHDPDQLAELRNQLITSVSERKDNNRQMLAEYHQSPASEKLKQHYSLKPSQTCTGNNSLFQAISRLFGQPSGKIQQNCATLNGTLASPTDAELKQRFAHVTLSADSSEIALSEAGSPDTDSPDTKVLSGITNNQLIDDIQSLRQICIQYGIPAVLVFSASKSTEFTGIYPSGELFSSQEAINDLANQTGQYPVVLVASHNGWLPMIPS